MSHLLRLAPTVRDFQKDFRCVSLTGMIAMQLTDH
jgi:hypothetical protein